MTTALEPVTSQNIEPLICDLVRWVAREPRTYDQVMDVWRTSCPRLTVWEDACDRQLLSRKPDGQVVVTSAGHTWLAQQEQS